MGKVASSSIFSSLQKQYLGPVGHGHHIGSDNWMSEVLYDWARSGKPLKIISPIREPIGRNVSAFFQMFDVLTGQSFKQSKYSTEDLIKLFMEMQDHDLPLEWFDKNINKHFNIDVYSKEFPKEGIATYSSGNIELLVIRIDLDDTQKELAINKFLNICNFKLNNSNMSNSKVYYQEYKKLIKELKLPNQYLEKMKQSKYFRHFYTDDEINKVIEKFKQ
jgi:hypothetical protein